MGHLGGMPMFLPMDWLKADPLTDFRRAPEYGQWVVISVDGPSRNDLNNTEQRTTAGRDYEPDR